ncbi:MAG: hypothetical protein LQ346_002923 [Caloplaca aetnensis]|nr:MAG: hypothetical protein LQ346_002923 [Caloplaca aetnensis]
MSSTEDAVSQSSSSPHQAAQPRDVEINHAGDLESLGGELIEDLSDTHNSDSFSALSSRPRSASGDDDSNEQLPLEEAASTSIKKVSPVRPNKHLGSHATWRDRTAAERQIAASLDQLRAKDLSAHLYNFYSLKRKLLTVEKRQEKELEYDGDLDAPGKAWISSKAWVAWPMVPELVPRENDAHHRDIDLHQGTLPASQAESSHENIQELLAARACRLAKEKFNEREWENSDVESPATPDDPWLTKQARILEEVEGPSLVEEDEPLVMADDEMAKRILQPSLNHIGVKLDAILMGLHHARSSYATYGPASKKTQATTDGDSSQDNKRKRETSRRALNSGRGQRRRVLRDVADDSMAEDTESDSSYERHTETDHDLAEPLRSRRRLGRLGLRDWSDVLGVASMCGWDAGTVETAVARCSALFGEGLVLRTLREGQDGYHEVSYLPKSLANEDPPRVASVTGNIHHQAAVPSKDQVRSETGREFDSYGYDQDGKVGGVHVDGFLQPIPKRKYWTRERKKPSKT